MMYDREISRTQMDNIVRYFKKEIRDEKEKIIRISLPFIPIKFYIICFFFILI